MIQSHIDSDSDFAMDDEDRENGNHDAVVEILRDVIQLYHNKSADLKETIAKINANQKRRRTDGT